jgi:hypothetical protein
MRERNRAILLKKLPYDRDNILHTKNTLDILSSFCEDSVKSDFTKPKAKEEFSILIKKISDQNRGLSILLRKIEIIYSIKNDKKNKKKLRYHIDDYNRTKKSRITAYQRLIVDYDIRLNKIDSINKE